LFDREAATETLSSQLPVRDKLGIVVIQCVGRIYLYSPPKSPPFRRTQFPKGLQRDRAAEVRLHQFCRCIDGLILSEPGQGRNQFKSRTELFVGSRHHSLMGEIYAIRSDVEHLHEHKYLEVFDRPTRLDLAK
jgi:hypothetical protein